MKKVSSSSSSKSTFTDNDIWTKYFSKFQLEPNSVSQLHSFAKTSSKYNTLSYKECKVIYDTFNKKNKKEKKVNFIQRDMVAAKRRLSQRMNVQLIPDDHSHDTDSDNSDNDDKDKSVPQIIRSITKKVKFSPFNRPQTAKYAKYARHASLSRPLTSKSVPFLHNGKQSIFSTCRRTRSRLRNNHVVELELTDMKNKRSKYDRMKVKKPPLSSYINKMESSHPPAFFHKIAKKKRKHNKEDSIISALSELSSPRFKHSFNRSILSNIDGPFSILPQLTDVDSEQQQEQSFFPDLELVIDDDDNDNDEYDEKHHFDHEENKQLQNEKCDDPIANIRIEVPINAATEIFGNFLGALCGLCVPALDVISSLEQAETYDLLSQYAANIDASGNAQTMLLYEELDGVSLFHLKQQLQVCQISLSYNENNNDDSSTTTQERIQRYFVSVVRKTFGMQLPAHFSYDGRSMIRDAGFLFAVDMFLFNRGRFPVHLPFEGTANANNLFISTDQDGDSVLYGLCNRFMGGHDIIDMPQYLLNGTSNYNDEILTKQREYTNKYIGRLDNFLSVLSDYYQTKISSNYNAYVENSNEEKDPNKLLHGLPPIESKNILDIDDNETKITHKDCINLCLRPIANYLYIHCGFELIIIDEYNKNPHSDNDNNDNDDTILKVLEVYRNKLIDNMITLLCEGILIGVSQISEQVEPNDIDIIIQDIKALDENMFGIQLISHQFLKVVLKLFQSASLSVELNTEDLSSDEDND